jgi:hypothetical protein
MDRPFETRTPEEMDRWERAVRRYEEAQADADADGEDADETDDEEP